MADKSKPNGPAQENISAFAHTAHTNRLVNWLPWGEETFQKAKQEQKPVFLHIGFPSCHWCHVMERESFENEEVADLLNAAFVCIDVDREQRPDVDAVYMAACHAMTGHGGWPLTALLAPSQKPFYIATYLPKNELLMVLNEARRKWATGRDRLTSLGLELSEAVRSQFTYAEPAVKPERGLLHNAVRAYASSFDAEWGGVGIAPKFPMAHTLVCLLRQGFVDGDKKALFMAETTLTRMCEGGLFDHVGGGFMRYATDRRWAIPHYEKMLIDNALLAHAYMEAWEITRRPLYRAVAERTLDYVLREMTDEDGGFYASQDADSNGEEGAYYELTQAELIEWLGKEDGTAYAAYYGIADKGLPNRIGYDGGIETQRMAALSEKVRQCRAERLPLARDDKQLTAWSALTIAALAHAFTATGNEKYLQAAELGAHCLRERVCHLDGSLSIYWKNGAAGGEGLLDDYAALAAATLALYRATLGEMWLAWAVGLSRAMLSRFEDRENNGFYLTPHGGEKLIARPKEAYDGAQPSGNAMALHVLVTLSMLDVGEGWADAAERQAAFLMGQAADAPLQHMAALSAVMPLLHAGMHLEVRAGADEKERLLKALRGQYAPRLYIKAAQPGSGGSSFRLCKGTTCLAPMREVESVLGLLS